MRNFNDISPSFSSAFGNIFAVFFYWLQIVSLFASLFLILGIVYSTIRINQIRKKEKERFKVATVPATQSDASPLPEPNTKWNRVVSLANSESEGDWRLAILEADIMLDDMMARMQYSGETLGERLKSVEKSDFNTIDSAWEAHKIRNQIAHTGNDFVLSKREVNRVIRLYRSVFEEFRLI